MQKEENKNENEAETHKGKENLPHPLDYDLDDDLENFVVKALHKDSDDMTTSLISGKKNRKEHFIRTSYNRGFDFKNILNIISLILWILMKVLMPVNFLLNHQK